MSEVEVRLSTVYEAARQLNASSDRLFLAVERVQHHVEELVGLGFESPAAAVFIEQYGSQRSLMSSIPETLRSFAQQLQRAADDLAAALEANTPESLILESPPPVSVPVPVVEAGALLTTVGTFGVPFYRRYGRRTVPTAAEEVKPLKSAPVMLTPSSYVSAGNRALFEEWTKARNEVSSASALRDDLLEQRQEKQQELNALKNRILTFNPGADLTRIERVVSLEGQIQALDAQIAALDGQISLSEARADELAERLKWVLPGAGADLEKIRALENGRTAQIVLDNTYDCVHYVASRLPIPANMATDAHLWNENVLKLTEYGVQQGNVPLPGSVLVMEREHPYADSVNGHVMYVEAVDERGVWVTDNLHPDKPVLLSALTSETSGPNISYVYFPWHTRA
jgi:hypothetical protein